MLLYLGGVRCHLIHLLGFKERLWFVHLLGQGDHGVGWKVRVQGGTETRGLKVF